MIQNLGNKKSDLIELLKILNSRRSELNAVGNNLTQPIAFLLDDAIWLIKNTIDNQVTSEGE